MNGEMTQENAQWQQFIAKYIPAKGPLPVGADLLSPVDAALPNGLRLKLRPEAEADYKEVEELTRRAFWGLWPENFEKLGGIGCDEHYLCRLLRAAPEFVPALDFVALDGGRIVGNVMFTMAYVKSSEGEMTPVLTFGPLSVLPEYRMTGVGAALMRHTISLARAMGHGGILFFGHPSYYPRLGFAEAASFGITTPKGESFPAFMGMELTPGYFSRCRGGALYESPLFILDLEKARAYDKQFPPIPRGPEAVPLRDIHLPFLHRLMNRPEILSALHGRQTALEDWRETYAFWQGEWDSGDEACFVVYQDAKPAAWLKLNGLNDKDMAWISMLAVLPEYRRKGIGAFAVDFAEGRIKEKGFSRVGIHANEDNGPARGLYEKLGYRVTEKGPCTNADGQSRTGLTYEKEI